jgi:hypothetical protein
MKLTRAAYPFQVYWPVKADNNRFFMAIPFDQKVGRTNQVNLKNDK